MQQDDNIAAGRCIKTQRLAPAMLADCHTLDVQLHAMEHTLCATLQLNTRRLGHMKDLCSMLHVCTHILQSLVCLDMQDARAQASRRYWHRNAGSMCQSICVGTSLRGTAGVSVSLGLHRCSHSSMRPEDLQLNLEMSREVQSLRWTHAARQISRLHSRG